MSPLLIPLDKQQCQLVSAGHTSVAGFFAITLICLEIPHHLVGLREFLNYSIDRYYNGCQNIEDGDYVTQFFCESCSS